MQSVQKFNMKTPGVHTLQKHAHVIRKLIIEMVVPKESHHIGCSLGIADIMVFLYFSFLKVNPQNPKDPNRDIFILSKGHAGAAFYATLHQKGFFSKKTLLTYDKNGSALPEHASISAKGVELSTGSLGHGLPVGIGCALSFRHDQKNNCAVVLMSDGELNEGSNWEAFMFAGHHKVDNLIAIIDYNGYQGYGETKKIMDLSPLAPKLKSFGWNTYEIDGHNFDDLRQTFLSIKKSTNKKPHCVIAHTIKGKGVSFFEGKFESHYKSIDETTQKQLLHEFDSLI